MMDNNSKSEKGFSSQWTEFMCLVFKAFFLNQFIMAEAYTATLLHFTPNHATTKRQKTVISFVTTTSRLGLLWLHVSYSKQRILIMPHDAGCWQGGASAVPGAIWCDVR